MDECVTSPIMQFFIHCATFESNFLTFHPLWNLSKFPKCFMQKNCKIDKELQRKGLLNRGKIAQ
jgi:hypothetical protein